jgi:hypothetical protein
MRALHVNMESDRRRLSSQCSSACLLAFLVALLNPVNGTAQTVGITCHLESIHAERRQVRVIRETNGERVVRELAVSEGATITLDGDPVPLERLHFHRDIVITFDSAIAAISRVQQQVPEGENPYVLRSWVLKGTRDPIAARLVNVEQYRIWLKSKSGESHHRSVEELSEPDLAFLNRCNEHGSWVESGKTADYWIRIHAGLAGTSSEQVSAALVLQRMGRRAHPALIRALKSQEPEARQGTLAVSSRFRPLPPDFIRSVIQLALIEEDVDVLKEIPFVLRSVKPEGVRSGTQRPGQALYALRAIDPEGVVALGSRFAELHGKSQHTETARRILQVVAPDRLNSLVYQQQMLERQTAAHRALHSMAGGPNASTSAHQFSLDYGALTSPDGAPAVKAGLRDERSALRLAALEVMWSNPRQHGAISELIEMLADEQDVQVWSRAAAVLKKATDLTDEQRAAAIPILAKKYDDEALFDEAAGALMNVAPAEHEARRKQFYAMLQKRNEQRRTEREQQQSERLAEQQQQQQAERERLLQTESSTELEAAPSSQSSSLAPSFSEPVRQPEIAFVIPWYALPAAALVIYSVLGIVLFLVGIKDDGDWDKLQADQKMATVIVLGGGVCGTAALFFIHPVIGIAMYAGALLKARGHLSGKTATSQGARRGSTADQMGRSAGNSKSKARSAVRMGGAPAAKERQSHVLHCIDCNATSKELAGAEPQREAPCPACGSRLTVALPYEQVEQLLAANAVILQGEDLFDADDFAGAIKKFRQAQPMRPDHPHLLLDLGNALCMRAWQGNDPKMFEEGLATLEHALRLYPSFDRARTNLESGREKYREMTGKDVTPQTNPMGHPDTNNSNNRDSRKSPPPVTNSIAKHSRSDKLVVHQPPSSANAQQWAEFLMTPLREIFTDKLLGLLSQDVEISKGTGLVSRCCQLDSHGNVVPYQGDSAAVDLLGLNPQATSYLEKEFYEPKRQCILALVDLMQRDSMVRGLGITLAQYRAAQALREHGVAEASPAQAPDWCIEFLHGVAITAFRGKVDGDASLAKELSNSRGLERFSQHVRTVLSDPEFVRSPARAAVQVAQLRPAVLPERLAQRRLNRSARKNAERIMGTPLRITKQPKKSQATLAAADVKAIWGEEGTVAWHECSCGERVLLGSESARWPAKCSKCGKAIVATRNQSRIQSSSASPSDASAKEDRVVTACPQCRKKIFGARQLIGKRVKCPQCQTSFPLFAARNETPSIQPDVPQPPAWRTVLEPWLRDDLRGFDNLPVDRLVDARDFIVSLAESLPQHPLEVIELHYARTGLCDPVQLPTPQAAFADLLRHVQQRIRGRRTAVWGVRHFEQSFADKAHRDIHWVMLQLEPENDPQPRYWIYHLDDGTYLLDRSRW